MTFSHRCASRREFIAGALGTAAGVCALGGINPSGLFAAETPPKSAEKLRLGLATYQWGMDWDIPTLIANLQKANVLGVELRTSSKYAHGVEKEISAQRRGEVKKQFADSPVKVVSVACGERMDWPEPEKLKASIEASKGYLKMSSDIGSSCVRVFPNQFQPNVPHEKTIEQIAKALNELGSYAADLGQRVDLEAHGPAGELPTMRAVMDQVKQKSVGIRLNCDKRDAEGKGFEANFNMVKDFLARVIHIHNLKDAKFPYQEQTNLLVKMGWDGWLMMENSEKVPDRIEAMIEQRKIWEGIVEKALKAKG